MQVNPGVAAAGPLLFQSLDWTEAAAAMQTVGDLEVSFFMVALFESLLIAHLQLRNEERSRLLVEVQALSGPLPICAWCQKVRTYDGYWQKTEKYFVSRSRVKFTRRICVYCTEEQFPDNHHVEPKIPPTGLSQAPGGG
jgi:hypothetical protein